MADTAKQGKTIARRELLDAYRQVLNASETQPDYPFEADSFFSNAASVWDVFNEYNKHYDYGDFWPNQVDVAALYGDSVRVMRYLWAAVEKFEAELPNEELPQQQRLFDVDEVRRVS